MDFIAKNCTARLAAAPPFSSGGKVSLGDLAPGQVAVARFWVSTEDDALAREYLMACELGHDGGTTARPFPVELSPKSLTPGRIIPFLAILLVISAGPFFFLTRRRKGKEAAEVVGSIGAKRPLEFETSVVAKDIVKSYKNFFSSRTTVLQDISLEISSDEIFGLLGPNGSGKTTLLSIFSTMIYPDSGSLMVLGIDARKNPDAIRRRNST